MKFITPVSMQVTKEQFEKDLKEPLKSLGYCVGAGDHFKIYPLLVTNNGNVIGQVGNIWENHKYTFNRYFINEYNPELFLALAAMTDEKYGIAREWWVCCRDIDNYFTEGTLYKATKPIDDSSAFTNNHGIPDGNHPNNLIFFRKATKEEIINHFTKNKKKMERKIIGYKAPYDLFDGRIKAGSIFLNNINSSYMYTELDSDKGVVREIVKTWEPVYVPQYKIGDWVITEGYHPDYDGKALKITNILDNVLLF